MSNLFSKSCKGSPVTQIKKPLQFFHWPMRSAIPTHSDLISSLFILCSTESTHGSPVSRPLPSAFSLPEKLLLSRHVFPGSSQRDPLFTTAAFSFSMYLPQLPVPFHILFFSIWYTNILFLLEYNVHTEKCTYHKSTAWWLFTNKTPMVPEPRSRNWILSASQKVPPLHPSSHYYPPHLCHVTAILTYLTT